MNAATTANAYKNQQIMTASPEELTLMLYNGAVRFATECVKAMDEGKLEQAHNANLRVQDIVKEFMSTLNMDYDISNSLFALYEYMNYTLIQANIKKDKRQVQQVLDMLKELRDTWMVAMKQVRVANAVGK